MSGNLSTKRQGFRLFGKLCELARTAVLCVCVLMMVGCATRVPVDFSASQTHFDLDRFFAGHSHSWGVFEDLHGQPKRHFTCDSFGKRDRSGDLILTQHFQFSDGKTQERGWHIHRVDATHWEASANDMVGLAEGRASGNAFEWEYTITVDRINPLATVHVRQWMYEIEGTDNVMTRLVISKLGVTVFEVSEVIHHVSGSAAK